jgi:hypothetical protein
MCCKFCQREINNRGSLVAHENVCKLNPNKIIYKRSPNAGRKKGKEYFVWNRGLDKDKDIRIAESAEKISVSLKGKPGKKATEEAKKKMSESRKKLYASGWEPTCGRCKKYDYFSPIAGHIKLDGKWELATAKYLDSIGVNWIRNRKRFNYIKPDGKESTYQPDFYVTDWTTYIEVKGYETDLDRAKWSQFPDKLEVWKRDKIESLKV